MKLCSNVGIFFFFFIVALYRFSFEFNCKYIFFFLFLCLFMFFCFVLKENYWTLLLRIITIILFIFLVAGKKNLLENVKRTFFLFGENRFVDQETLQSFFFLEDHLCVLWLFQVESNIQGRFFFYNTTDILLVNERKMGNSQTDLSAFSTRRN